MDAPPSRNGNGTPTDGGNGGSMLTENRIVCQSELKAPRQGAELIANSSGNRGVALQGGAESGALSGDSAKGGALPAPTDPDLLAVVAAWPNLSETVRHSIVTMANRVGG